jgi:penicillin-binding protein 1A
MVYGMVQNLVTESGCDRSARFKTLLMDKEQQQHCHLGYFMKLCYADSSLKVSKGNFDRPANLSIKVDCYTAPKKVKDRRFKIQMSLNSKNLELTSSTTLYLMAEPQP